MIDNHTVLAVIPARAGSKGLPGKNIRPLCGKPLIAWSIEAGLAAKHVDKVLVSTDGVEIADTARRHGADVPFLRPAELAADTTPTLPVIEHALAHLSSTVGLSFDIVVLLEPTSPLREPDDVDRMLQKLTDRWNDFDAVVSVGEVREHPSIMKRLVGDEIEPFCPDLPPTTRRQDNAVAYFPYGVAYIAKTQTLLSERTFYPRRSTWYPLQRHQTYEIDDYLDFVCVEAIMRSQMGVA